MSYNSPQENNLLNTLDSLGSAMYTCPIITQKVGKSGGRVKCSMESMNTTLIARGVSSFPQNLERSSKKIMWNDFSSLEVLIRVSLYSRKMNGRDKNRNSNRFRSRTARPGNLIDSIFQAPARWPVIGKGGF